MSLRLFAACRQSIVRMLYENRLCPSYYHCSRVAPRPSHWRTYYIMTNGNSIVRKLSNAKTHRASANDSRGTTTRNDKTTAYILQLKTSLNSLHVCLWLYNSTTDNRSGPHSYCLSAPRSPPTRRHLAPCMHLHFLFQFSFAFSRFLFHHSYPNLLVCYRDISMSDYYILTFNLTLQTRLHYILYHIFSLMP